MGYMADQNYGEILKYGFYLIVAGVAIFAAYEIWKFLQKNPQDNPANPLNYTNGGLANPVSQLGASDTVLYNLPSNYQGATVTYATTPQQTAADLSQLTQAFRSGQQNAAVVVSNTGEISTYGGAIANPLPQSGLGSPYNPYLLSGGYRGAGTYSNGTGGLPITITSLSDYRSTVATLNGTPQPSGGFWNLL